LLQAVDLAQSRNISEIEVDIIQKLNQNSILKKIDVIMIKKIILKNEFLK
jgi:hypothetical protein